MEFVSAARSWNPRIPALHSGSCFLRMEWKDALKRVMLRGLCRARYHGLRNDANTPFVDLSVTASPIHFGYANQERKEAKQQLNRDSKE